MNKLDYELYSCTTKGMQYQEIQSLARSGGGNPGPGMGEFALPRMYPHPSSEIESFFRKCMDFDNDLHTLEEISLSDLMRRKRIIAGLRDKYMDDVLKKAMDEIPIFDPEQMGEHSVKGFSDEEKHVFRNMLGEGEE